MGRPHGTGRSFRPSVSIQQTFLVIAITNGIALLYLIVSSFRLLLDRNVGSEHHVLTLLFTLLLAILAAISARIIVLRVVRPLARLARDSRRIEAGDPDVLLSVVSDDEVGRVATAFNRVLTTMRQTLLELEEANQRLQEAQRQINDSISYAGLLQRAILPDRQLQEVFGDEHFILWQPRDTVGGDYYMLHSEGSCCLAGVADCAGHGVPGAMMTMLARSGIDRAIEQVGLSSPAAVLTRIDAAMRAMLGDAQQSRAMATTMDMGLVALDAEAMTLRFAGAKISLYWSDGQRVERIKGDGRALCDRRPGLYRDHEVPLRPGFTYYLSTDGVLDQSGGRHGFGVGSDRFSSWVREHAAKPLQEQSRAFSEALERFRGGHPQRDDITILSFRCRPRAVRGIALPQAIQAA